MSLPPTSPEFFEEMYRNNPDPWNFAGSRYELGRYDTILRSLEGRQYAYAFEPGCSVGVLTEKLADVCDRLLSIDFSSTAVEQARARCAGRPHVEIRCASVFGTLPEPGLDLLVLSEIGYYFSPAEWAGLLDTLVDRVRPGGTVLAAHWLGHSEDHSSLGDEVHRTVRAHPLLRLEHEERPEGFRLDRLVRV